MIFQARQGDVFVMRIPMRARAAAEPVGIDQTHIVLAYGETTGHAHRVIPAVAATREGRNYPPVQAFEEPDGQRYLIVDEACVLTHEEHGPIAIEPGCYRVVIQREYTPEGVRSVRD